MGGKDRRTAGNGYGRGRTAASGIQRRQSAENNFIHNGGNAAPRDMMNPGEVIWQNYRP
jgi:hypothetical protein